MELKKPKRPLRKDCVSDKQYLDRFQAYKRERRKWLNMLKTQDNKKATESKNKLKEKKKYRTMKDSEFKRKQLDETKQTRLM